MFYRILRILFFILIIRPLVLLLLGLNIRNKQKLPLDGPAIIIANHNSHLDTVVLMSLFPLSKLHKLRPVAAADYFLSNKLLAWFSVHILNIIPVSRSRKLNHDKVFSPLHQALNNGDILVLFPEGSRGKPEQAGKLKKGIFYLVKDRTDTKIVPVVMHGLGRALPRGEALFVPFNCDVVIGDALPSASSSAQMLQNITNAYLTLREHCLTRNTLDE